MAAAREVARLREDVAADAPPVGTKCFPCYLAGHFCPAKTWAYELAVCEECAAGVTCAQRQAVARMLANIGDTWWEKERGVA